MPIPESTKALIVGAGPSGLMMAAQLLRYGIQPVIIDSKDGPTTKSKALAVQARSLEIYRQMGIVDEAVNNGKQSQGVIMNYNGKRQASLPLYDLGKGQTPFPYVLMYQQSKNERLLLDFLTQHTCPVYWNTTLTSLEQNANGATAHIENNDANHTITCDWIIGADGARSTVRKQLQISFNGDTYAHLFYLIDAKLDNCALEDNYVNLFLGKNYFNAFFPMAESESFRIIGNLPEEYADREDVTIKEVLPYLDSATFAETAIKQNNWFTIYKLHHRMAGQFRQQRCFLIGDAAHIHSPVGGQGMNTGLQDAYNLAWKLAGVIKGKIRPTILETYAGERMPVARELLRSTDMAFNIVISKKWFARLFKKLVLIKLINIFWKSGKLKEGFFRRISQIDINYRHSPLSLHLGYGTKIKAGDRLPYLPIYDEKKETETDLHEWCSKPGFTLIVLGRFEEMFLFSAARWISQQYNGVLNFYYLPPSGKNVKVFEAFEADPHAQKAIVVRPDMYIGYINDVVDLGIIDNYLRNVAGVFRGV